MKKRYKKSLKVTIIAIMITAALIGMFCYFNLFDSLGGGGVLNNSNTITFDCPHNYRNLFLKLEVNGTNLSGTVNYYIRNPNGDIVDKGEISESINNFKIDKKYKGEKGTWKIEFINLSGNEKITYKITEVATNRNSYKSHI